MTKKEQRFKKRLDKARLKENRKPNWLYKYNKTMGDVWYLTDGKGRVSSFYYDLDEGHNAWSAILSREEEDKIAGEELSNIKKKRIEKKVQAESDIEELGKNASFFSPSAERIAGCLKNKIPPSGTLYVGSGFQSSSDEELANALGKQ